MDRKYNFEELRSVIAALRSENGCPWDKKQTHESLKPCMINEMVEAVAGINIYKETGDGTNLCEELGDVLLQVLLQSQIAEEEGLFNVEDVISGLCEKMIRRHPHVFAGQAPGSDSALLARWDEIKKKEKSGRSKEHEKNLKDAEKAAKIEVFQYLESDL